MAKFLILWNLDTTRVPENPQEQMALFSRLMYMVDEDFKSGMLDWGEFVSGQSGYAINEGTEQELGLALMKYSPYIKFKVHPVLSASQVKENMKAISQS
jgi:hypothetical protein